MQLIQVSRHQARVCVRISRVVLVCVLPLVGYAQQLPTVPHPQCTFTTPGRCAAQISRDQKGIVKSPFHLQKKDLVWLAPLAAATGTAFALDHTALQSVSTD